MSEKCVRCNEEEPKVECSDCLSSKRKGEVAALCDACSELIHVGFLEEHDVQPIALKLKKQEFKSQLEVFKKYDQKFKFKQNEIGYAKQDIETRIGVTQRAIHEALGKVFQAMKDKEQELLGVVKESVVQKKLALTDCETKLTDTVAKYNTILKETDGVLKAEQSEFMEKCEEVEKKIADSSILKIESSFPSLGPLATIDISPLLTSVERVQLSDVDEGVDISMPDVPKPVEEGDVLKVYMESRMDANGYFWVSRDMDAELNSMLDNISYQIREDIVLNPVEKMEVTEGMVCIAQYQQDHRWYRAKVEQVKANQVGWAGLYFHDHQWYRGLVEQYKPGQTKAQVRWLDYAHENEVAVTHLYPLKTEFKSIPFQAMQCCLIEELEGEMSRPARWEFSDHTANATLECTVIKILTEKQLYLVELKNKEKPNIDIKQRISAKMGDTKGKKDLIQCRDIRYMKDYTPPPASEIRAKQKQERDQRKGKRGGKDKRQQQGQSAEESESGRSGRSTPDGSKDDKKKLDKSSEEKVTQGSPNQNVSSTTGADTTSSAAAGSGGQQVTILKKSGEGGNTEQSTKPGGDSKGGPVNSGDSKPTDTVKDNNQTPEDQQSQLKSDSPKQGDITTNVINTEAPSLLNSKPSLGISVGMDQSKVFVPISSQLEKVPVPTIGGIISYPTGKEREAMVPPMQTFISPSTGSGISVGVIVSTPSRSSAPVAESEEEERDRQLTERLAQQGDHGMAHNPDSASTLLPEVSQLFQSQSSLPQGTVPLPGQIMQGGPMQGSYANYPTTGYNYNVAPMQPQHGYYSQHGYYQMPMGLQGIPLQQPIHPGEMLPDHMHEVKAYHEQEIITRSPPPPYSREVEQVDPDSTTSGWDENNWNQPTARITSGPSRNLIDDRNRDSSAAEEDSYRDGMDGFVENDDVNRSLGQHPSESSPMPDQRRPADYRDNRPPRSQGRGFSCYRCGQTGHIARDCPVPPQPGERPKRNQPRGGDRRGGGNYRKSDRGRRK